jgi:hypothetical protein
VKIKNLHIFKSAHFQISLACLAVVEPVSFHDVLFEVQRTETFIEREINEFFTKVQRTVTKDVEMWRCEDASPELVEG